MTSITLLKSEYRILTFHWVFRPVNMWFVETLHYQSRSPGNNSTNLVTKHELCTIYLIQSLYTFYTLCLSKQQHQLGHKTWTLYNISYTEFVHILYTMSIQTTAPTWSQNMNSVQYILYRVCTHSVHYAYPNNSTNLVTKHELCTIYLTQSLYTFCTLCLSKQQHQLGHKTWTLYNISYTEFVHILYTMPIQTTAPTWSQNMNSVQYILHRVCTHSVHYAYPNNSTNLVTKHELCTIYLTQSLYTFCTLCLSKQQHQLGHKTWTLYNISYTEFVHILYTMSIQTTV